MIVSHSSEMVNTSGMESVSFGIEGSALIYRLMYSTMFQDKEKVVLQELSANALDAHNTAGKRDVPIRITLPTEMSPELVIEDEGVGMSYETVSQVYPVYGRSSKSGSNTDIGGFGYGGKSPFSISESYTIETTHVGVTTTVACYLDNGFPKFSVFKTGNVGKPDGTIVRVPVSDTTRQRVLKEKAAILFLLWDVKPTIAGQAVNQISDTKLEETAHLMIFKPDTGIYSYKYGHKTSEYISKVAVGPFTYAIPESMVTKLAANKDFTALGNCCRRPLSYDAIFKFNIGEVELSPSREWIEDTDANTKTILAACKAEMDIIRGTQKQVGIDWYEEIAAVVKSKGIWLHDLVPSTRYTSVPLIVDQDVVKDKLLELRGTDTNLLTNNFDQYVWDQEVLPEVTKDYASGKKYAFSTETSPVRASSLLYHFRVDNPNYDHKTMSWSERWIPFSCYHNMLSSTTNFYQEALNTLLGVASEAVMIKRVDSGKIRTSPYSSPAHLQKLNTGHTTAVDKILLYTESTGAKVNAWLRAQTQGNYLIVQATDEVIKNIVDYCEKYKDKFEIDVTTKFALAAEVETAYAAYREALKISRKATVAGTRTKSTDVVVGTVLTDFDADTVTFTPITRGALESYNFSDTSKTYVICTTEALDYTSYIDPNTREKFKGCLDSLTIITVQSSKTKAQWWATFADKMETEHPQVLITKSVNTYSSNSPVRKLILDLPSVVSRTKMIKDWDTYIGIYNSFRRPDTYLKQLHPNGFTEEFIRHHAGYGYGSSPETVALKADIMSNPDAKSAYAKIAISSDLSDASFLQLITAAEKTAYLDIVNKHVTLE